MSRQTVTSQTYSRYTGRLINNTHSVSASTFNLIKQIDDTILRLSLIIDRKLVQANGISLDHDQGKVDDIMKLAKVIEDLTDKKSQLAVKNYDLIDHNMKIVDHQLKVIQKVKRSHPTLSREVPASDEGRDVLVNTDVQLGKDTTGAVANNDNSKKRKLTTSDDIAIDPNEPVYCFCRQVAYGAMVSYEEI